MDHSEIDLIRRPWVWLLMILLLALGLRVLDFTDPWSWNGPGFRNRFGTYASGKLARNFYEHGFTETGFLPFLTRIELADGSLRHDFYAHHPALYSIVNGLAFRILGPQEWVLRLPLVLLSMLSVVAFYRLFHTIGGRAVAAAATVAMAVIPLSAHYGTMAWVTMGEVAVHCLLLRQYVLWLRTDRRRHLKWSAFYAGIGGLLDWPAHFILPGLFIHAAITCWAQGGWSRFRPFLIVPVVGALTIVLHAIHVMIVMPLGHAKADTRSTLEMVWSLPVSYRDFLERQGNFLLQFLTAPVVVLVVLGALGQIGRTLLWRTTTVDRLLFVMFVPGFLYVFLFPGRSYNHNFFAALSLPYFAGTAGLVALRAWEAVRQRSSIAGMLLALAILAVIGHCVHVNYQLWQQHRGPGLKQVVESPWLSPILDNPDAVILTGSSRGMGLPFYARGPVYYGISTPVELARHDRDTLSKISRDRPVYFVFDRRDFRGQPSLHRELRRRGTSTLHGEFEVFQMAPR